MAPEGYGSFHEEVGHNSTERVTRVRSIGYGAMIGQATLILAYIVGAVLVLLLYPVVVHKDADNKEDYLAHGLGASIFWPFLLVLAIIAAPFILVDRYFKWVNERRAVPEPPRKSIRQIKAEVDAEMAEEMMRAVNQRKLETLDRAQRAALEKAQRPDPAQNEYITAKGFDVSEKESKPKNRYEILTQKS